MESLYIHDSTCVSSAIVIMHSLSRTTDYLAIQMAQNHNCDINVVLCLFASFSH